MKKTSVKSKIPTAEQIAELVDHGEDVSRFFSNKGKMIYPQGIHRVNIDFTKDMLDEIDQVVEQLNISRQAVIKMWLRQALDQHYQAKNLRSIPKKQ